jgi:hypothetical protein
MGHLPTRAVSEYPPHTVGTARHARSSGRPGQRSVVSGIARHDHGLRQDPVLVSHRCTFLSYARRGLSAGRRTTSTEERAKRTALVRTPSSPKADSCQCGGSTSSVCACRRAAVSRMSAAAAVSGVGNWLMPMTARAGSRARSTGAMPSASRRPYDSTMVTASASPATAGRDHDGGRWIQPGGVPYGVRQGNRWVWGSEAGRMA